MGQKKEQTWEERYPLTPRSHANLINGFEGLTSLGVAPARAALRALKRLFEKNTGIELSDGQFLDIFFRVISLAPASPLGPWSYYYGFTLPLERFLKERGLHCDAKGVLDFFGVCGFGSMVVESRIGDISLDE